MKNKVGFMTVAVCCVIAAVGLVYAIVAGITSDPYGLQKISTTDELLSMDITVNYFVGQSESTEVQKIRDLEKNKELYIDMTAAAPVVLLVEPIGTFQQYLGSYCQEVEILQVVRNDSADALRAGDTVELFRQLGLSVIDDELHFMDGPNVLYPENQYLLFLQPSELNHMYRQKQYNLLENSQFACIRLYYSEPQQICVSTKLSDNQNMHNLCMSQKVLDRIVEIENALIEHFLGKEYING